MAKATAIQRFDSCVPLQDSGVRPGDWWGWKLQRSVGPFCWTFCCLRISNFGSIPAEINQIWFIAALLHTQHCCHWSSYNCAEVAIIISIFSLLHLRLTEDLSSTVRWSLPWEKHTTGRGKTTLLYLPHLEKIADEYPRRLHEVSKVVLK